MNYTRLNVQLTKSQHEALRKLSYETRKSLSDHIRQAVDNYLNTARKQKIIIFDSLAITDASEHYSNQVHIGDNSYKINHYSTLNEPVEIKQTYFPKTKEIQVHLKPTDKAPTKGAISIWVEIEEPPVSVNR